MRAPAAPVAPRVPSEAVLATYREDAREMRRLLTTMREDVVPSAHDPLLDVLLGGDLALRTVDLLEVGQVPVGHAAGHAIGASVRAVAMTEGILMGGSAIVATLAVLAEIGHANAEGRVEGERLAAIDAYAAGVGAGLDPAGATGRPSDPTHAALYDRGLAEVAGLSPAERIDLEDHLVLWANAATDPHFDDRRKHATLWAVLPDYDAATYATGLASLVGMGRWDPQN